MELFGPTHGATTSDCCHKRLSGQGCPSYFWKATTWSRPILVTSENHWQYGCSVHSPNIDIPDYIPRDYKLLHKVMTVESNKEGKAGEGILSLGCLRMAYPTMSIADDDDIVYLFAKGSSKRSMAMVLAVDVRMRTLQGAASLSKRHDGFLRYFLASGISKHFKTTGTSVVSTVL